MTKETLKSLNIGIDLEDNKVLLTAQAAIEWIERNTTIDTEDIENFPAGAKLFIDEFISINSLASGVSSESIGGLSQSFTTEDKESLIWDKANTLIGAEKLKSRVRFVSAQKRWA